MSNNHYRTMVKPIGLLLVIYLISINAALGQKGKDGEQAITVANQIVNEYAPLTYDANAGSFFLKVSNNQLNLNNRFSAVLATGDLLMIIQMQGASINGTSGDSTWGAVTGYNNCGLYEFMEVAGVSDTATIDLKCSLKNNYTASGKTQVIRVPRYVSLTVDSGGVLTCEAWNGVTGGIIAIEVNDSTVVNSGGMIDASAKGFRGGALQNVSSVYFGISSFASNDLNSGGQKGESIAGYQADYNSYRGMYGRGAPANGGGGGNSANASGGGGANAGNINKWTGNGNPDTSSNALWKQAWNLEYMGFAKSFSSGGGRGGYTWADGNNNPLLTGPGVNAWIGDSRRNHGGKGGRPLDYSSGRIFLGGGGGAGHENNNNGGRGGNGGGIIFLISNGTVTGSGSIVSNGEDGQGTVSDPGDGSGGGGAGGTILISSADSIKGITIKANGGKGGSQIIGTIESEGPGGGGGGGYIAISAGSVTTEASGGMNGTTSAQYMVNFPPNGATKGGDGLADETIVPVSIPAVTADAGSDVSVCTGKSITLSASGGTDYLWSPSIGLSCISCSSPDASPLVTTTYTVTVSSSTCSASDQVVVQATPGNVAGIISALRDTICAGTPGSMKVAGNSGNIQWQSSVTQGNFTDINAATDSSYLVIPDQTTWYRVIAGTGSCADTSTPFRLVVVPSPVAFYTYSSSGNGGLNYSFNADSSKNVTVYNWDFGDGATAEDIQNPIHEYVYADTFHVCLTTYNGSNCSYTICRDVPVNYATGMVNTLVRDNWNIYPNPAGDELTIDKGTLIINTVDIKNLLGQTIITSPFLHQIDLNSLPGGIYFLSITTKDNNQFVKKFVRE